MVNIVFSSQLIPYLYSEIQSLLNSQTQRCGTRLSILENRLTNMEEQQRNPDIWIAVSTVVSCGFTQETLEILYSHRFWDMRTMRCCIWVVASLQSDSAFGERSCVQATSLFRLLQGL